MTNILSITASPYGTASRGAMLASKAIANLRTTDPALTVVERKLADLPASELGRDYADAIMARRPREEAVFALSETLIREVEEAAFIVLATPMHNYTVPASLKTWIDLVLRHGRSFAPVNGVKTGLLGNRPVLVAVTSGSMMTGPCLKQPDHLTGYLRDVFATIGMNNVRFLHLDGLVDPARAETAMEIAAAQLTADPVFGCGDAPDRSSPIRRLAPSESVVAGR